MSADDVAAVREALESPTLPRAFLLEEALAALDRLVARLQEAERERDEFIASGEIEMRKRLAAEAREAALREALTDIDDYLRTCEPFIGPRHSTKAEVIVRRVRQRIAALAAEVGEAG